MADLQRYKSGVLLIDARSGSRRSSQVIVNTHAGHPISRGFAICSKAICKRTAAGTCSSVPYLYHIAGYWGVSGVPRSDHRLDWIAEKPLKTKRSACAQGQSRTVYTRIFREV